MCHKSCVAQVTRLQLEHELYLLDKAPSESNLDIYDSWNISTSLKITWYKSRVHFRAHGCAPLAAAPYDRM